MQDDGKLPAFAYCVYICVYVHALARDHETLPACRAAFRRLKGCGSASARRSLGRFIPQFSRHCSVATFATRHRNLSAFGPRQAAATRKLAFARHEMHENPQMILL